MENPEGNLSNLPISKLVDTFEFTDKNEIAELQANVILKKFFNNCGRKRIIEKF